jgi:hypothetical protein
MADPRIEGLSFLDDRERMFFAQASLGENAVQFLHSDVGRYLHGCAKQEVETLRDELETVNLHSFFGRRKLKKLQMKAQAARYFMQWMAECIQDGEAAYHQLEEYRS